VRAIKEVITWIKEVAVITGLATNESKTNYLKINRNIRVTNLEQELIIDRQVLEGVQNFRYLCALILYEN
jgi:hypothetical protein